METANVSNSVHVGQSEAGIFPPHPFSQNRCQVMNFAKLQPRRCQKSASSQPNEPQLSEMRFMPTPGIIGLDVAVHGPDLQPNVSFDNMVDDLQLMEHKEQSMMKVQRAKNIRNLRDSVRFHAQRNMKPD
ncbi:Uncharacterized protein Fot_23439 [Forsythia ovata]|uniref:Uncharacterized protein n=1 Tax=Forsythia ovata TaxID=205694 RepID=A0ABD1V2I0_9LAMI